METKPIRNIFQRIIDIMAELDYLQKGEKKAGGMYRYVSHDQVAAAIHPLLVKHGVVIIPTVKEMKQDGNRTCMCVLVTFINSDNPEESFVVESYGYGIDTSDKGPGKAYSYAFKYALLKTFCLETGDDPDDDQQSKHEVVISKEQYEKLLEFNLPNMSVHHRQIYNKYKIPSYTHLPDKDFEKVYNELKIIHKNINPSKIEEQDKEV